MLYRHLAVVDVAVGLGQRQRWCANLCSNRPRHDSCLGDGARRRPGAFPESRNLMLSITAAVGQLMNAQAHKQMFKATEFCAEAATTAAPFASPAPAYHVFCITVRQPIMIIYSCTQACT